MSRFLTWGFVGLLTLRLAANGAFAQDGATAPTTDAVTAAAPAVVEFNNGHIAWMLMSSALVLMMTAPGLALFYGGLVRKKNVLGVMMQCVFLMGLMSVVWAVYGYSLAFGPDLPGSGGFVGNLDMALLNGVLPTWDAATKTATIPAYGTAPNAVPKSLHMVFQMMFFIITPALICGAFAERMKFSTMVVFSLLWGTFVYCPVAHWVWSDTGWFNELNANAKVKAIDFAGGLVVHVTSGLSALICCLVMGKRLGFGQEPMPPHNLTYTCIGAALLWVGWFGFNGGGALAADARAVNAFVTTHMAAAAGTLAWAGMEWFKRGKPSILGACSGAVAGLVCVTPASGSATPMAGIILGVAAGAVCFIACTSIKNSLGYDDSLDAFGVHGVGGALGAILTGVFANPAITGTTETAGSLFTGNLNQVMNQSISVLAAASLAIVGSLVLLKILDAAMGLRVNQASELQGLDISEHGEEGYIFH